MRSTFVVVMWIWLAVSLGVYGYRLWRRITRGPKNARSVDHGSEARSGPNQPMLKSSDPRTDPDASEEAHVDTRRSESTSADSESPDSESTESETPLLSLPGTKGQLRSDDATIGQGLFGPIEAAVSSPGAATNGPTGRPPIAQALSGIEMPAGLTPLIGAGAPQGTFDTVFFSTSASAAELGVALGEELQRLGYSIRSISDTDGIADRDGTQLYLTLHPRASRAKLGTEPRFPSIPSDAVVVEFST